MKLEEMAAKSKHAGQTSSVATCQICNTREAAYSCPKCRVPYCSVHCYRNHKEDCVESFYEGRVNQVLQLEVKERKGEMKNILQRIHNDQRNNERTSFLEEAGENRKHSEEELKQLWCLIEGCKTEEDWDTLVRSSSEIQAAIASMQHDQLENSANLEEWCLEPWHPWWMPQLATADDDDEQVFDEINLDEQILATPSFNTLCRQNPHSSLPFNLVEILYGISLTLRLFHGVQNGADVSEEVVAALLNSSTVLGQDEVYESLDDAVSGKGDATALNDLSVLLGNYRFVARALLEGEAIFQRVKNSRRLAKKMVYYLSWSLSHTAMVKQLSEDMDTWLSNYNTAGEDQDRIP